MKKRGIISLETLVKFIPAVLIAITALYVLFMLWGAFFAEEMSVPQTDVVRVAENIRSLNPGESVDVFTKGQEYFIILHEAGNDELLCSKKACVCVQEFDSGKKDYFTTKCEVFNSDDCSKAANNPKVICVQDSSSINIENIDTSKQIDYLTVSRSEQGGFVNMGLKRISL